MQRPACNWLQEPQAYCICCTETLAQHTGVRAFHDSLLPLCRKARGASGLHSTVCCRLAQRVIILADNQGVLLQSVLAMQDAKRIAFKGEGICRETPGRSDSLALFAAVAVALLRVSCGSFTYKSPYMQMRELPQSCAPEALPQTL